MIESVGEDGFHFLKNLAASIPRRCQIKISLSKNNFIWCYCPAQCRKNPLLNLSRPRRHVSSGDSFLFQAPKERSITSSSWFGSQRSMYYRSAFSINAFLLSDLSFTKRSTRRARSCSNLVENTLSICLHLFLYVYVYMLT
jgi:hypothetical protein